MSTTELIVLFARGTEEGAARSVVEKAGARIRRRMRSDHEDQVMLLVKVATDKRSKAEQEITRAPGVIHVEVNGADYSIS